MRKPCCDKEGNNKGAWSNQEDQKLIDYIRAHGEGSWRSLPKAAGLHRCGKSCRLRWINYLRPNIKRGNFDQDEEDLIIKLHALLGNRWSLIAGRLPGRTDNEVKNYWNSHIRKKLVVKGIDPTNRKLSQTALLPHQPQKKNNSCSNPADASSRSSSMKVEAACDVKLRKHEPSGDKNVTGSCQKPSDNNASSLEDETSGQSHKWRSELNLDLTISFPSSGGNFFKENRSVSEMVESCWEIDCGGSPPTLLLFR
ncbi:hypothetical protein SAY86_012290 [Trapa natans]|uniref:Uncharacterized protein n=1 Tax=Trapa natans TaxID=22666 RepID=A0AAN7RBG3_TRANT|nr:hypothetical protein SAY86_012290 [Trapa natans]